MKDSDIRKILREYSKKPYFIKDYNEFLIKLSVVPSASKRILEAKWGLDNKGICETDSELIQKIGVGFSSVEYVQAQQDFLNAKYAIYLENPESLDYMFAVRFGKLVKDYCNYIRHWISSSDVCLDDYIGKTNPHKLLECIMLLETKYRKILIYHYGLLGNECETLETIGHRKNVSISRASQWLSQAFGMLRNLHYRFSKIEIKYYSELLELIATKNCSNRVYLMLRRNGITTIEEFKSLTEEEISGFKGVGGTIIKEIMELKSTL